MKIRATSKQGFGDNVHRRSAVLDNAELARRRADVARFFASRKVPSQRKAEDRQVQMLDYIEINKNVPGTALRRGMRGTVVEICGSPAESVRVEVTSKELLEDVEVGDFFVLSQATKADGDSR